MEKYPVFVKEPESDKHSYTFICLHGLGQSAQNIMDQFLQYFPKMLDRYDEFKLVFPQAPIRYVTRDNNSKPSWFDIKSVNQYDESVNIELRYSLEEFQESQDQIVSIIEAEAQKLNNDFSRIFICGYSQGVRLALHIGFTYHQKLGGIIAINGNLLKITEIKEVNKETPVILCHSINDTIVPWEHAKASYERIVMQPNVILKNYEAKTHAILPQEFTDLSEWIKSSIKN